MFGVCIFPSAGSPSRNSLSFDTTWEFALGAACATLSPDSYVSAFLLCFLLSRGTFAESGGRGTAQTPLVVARLT